MKKIKTLIQKLKEKLNIFDHMEEIFLRRFIRKASMQQLQEEITRKKSKDQIVARNLLLQAEISKIKKNKTKRT